MLIKMETLKVDLGETPIENIFLNQYLQVASGNALKVYLYGLQYAHTKANVQPLRNEIIAENLDLSVDEVIQAWDYWLTEGVIKKIQDENGEDVYTFLSIRQLYLGFSYEENKELVDAGQKTLNLRTREMVARIEEVLQMNLKPNEIMKIIEHREELGQSTQLIARAFEYAAETTGKKNLNYVLGVLRHWHMDNIQTEEDLDNYLDNQKEKERQPSIGKGKRKYFKNQRSSEAQDLSNKELKKLLQEKMMRELFQSGGDKE